MGEEGVEIGEHVGGVPLLGADDFAGDAAVAVDDVGFGDHDRAVGYGDGRAIVLSGGIAVGGEDDGLIGEELLIRRGVLVRSDAQDDSVARGDVLLQAVERRGFLDAGWAPGGPEIKDDHLAAEIGEVGGLASEVEREVLGRFSGDGSFALAITWQGKDQQDRYRDCEPAPSSQSATDSHRVLY